MANLIPLQQQEKFLQALAVALQHPAVAADQQHICTLLQVSKAVRTAVQHSAASILDCSFSLPLSPVGVRQAISFSKWLAKHAGLVCTLTTMSQHTSDTWKTRVFALCAAMNQLVGSGLQAAARQAAGCTSVAPLHLRSYSSPIPASAGLLAALPTATLTYLDLTADESNWFAPLSKLINLRHLCLGMFDVQPEEINSCLQEVGKLQQISQLQLIGLAVESNLQVLPTQLQQLELQYRQGYTDDPESTLNDAHVNLQHLISLQRLQLEVHRLIAVSSIPVNLQSLMLHAEWPAAGVAGLDSIHQVTAIELSSSGIGREHLELLQHLRQLRYLSLDLKYYDFPLEVAAVWHKLPLCALSILTDTVTTTALQQLMQHVATATRLSKLDLLFVVVMDGLGGDRLAFCEQLQALIQLKSLSLSIGFKAADCVEFDAQHLSALVGLTSLELRCRGGGPCATPCIDETTLCLLAMSLTGLRALAIGLSESNPSNKVPIPSVLPAIGRLTQLEDLRLGRLPCDVAQRGLHFLTGLSRLTTLHGFRNAGEAALQEFRANINKLEPDICF